MDRPGSTSGKDIELKHYMQKLSEAEANAQQPDAWFYNPRGWMKRPSYKKTSRPSSLVGGMRGLFQKGGYKQRWFILDTNARVLMYYKDDDAGTPANGSIDISTVETIRVSRASDAPEFAIDLVATDSSVYTLVMESHESMVRWAYAINLAMGKPSVSTTSAREGSISSSFSEPKANANAENASQVQWEQYEVRFEEQGPLMLNVMGTANRDKDGKIVNSWIVVTSFESYPDGRPGRAEQTGKIGVKDYVVGVNGTELTDFTFNEAMDAIVGASWPKTLHFLRDNSVSRERSRVESWALIFHPSMNRQRRRYCELKGNIISFRKPAHGGSATNQREGLFCIDKVTRIRPIVDKTASTDRQFVLLLECSEEATIEYLDDDDVTVGTSPVDILEMCFAKESHMNSWRSALISPTDRGTSGAGIAVLPIETVDENSKEESAGKRNVIGVRSYLTGRFAPRELSYMNGILKWKRVEKSNLFNANVKEKSIFIVSPSACALQSVKAVDDPTEAKTGYRYQLHLQTLEHSIILGMGNEAMLLMWLTSVRDSLALCPPELLEGVVIPSSIEVARKGTSISRMRSKYADEYEGATFASDDASPMKPRSLGDDRTVQGYLFKRGTVKPSPDTNGNGLADSTSFRKRWFVLKDGELYFYKSQSDAQTENSSRYALGYLDLRSVVEVRESLDENAPENAIEICTSKNVYLVVAEDEDELVRWLGALSDALEYRSTGILADNDLEEPGVDDVERIAEIKNNMTHSGILSLRCVNKITSESSWRDRFFVIANNSVHYYEMEGDAYDPDKDCLGEFSLVAVTKIETTNENDCQKERTFDIHAHVSRGGDSRGIRVFTLMCRSTEECMEWMSILCDGTDTLEMIERTDGPGYTSTISEAAMKKRESAKLEAMQRFANMSTVNDFRERGSSLGDAGSRRSSLSGRGNALSGGRGRGRGVGLDSRRSSAADELPLPPSPSTNVPPFSPPKATTGEGDGRVSQATLAQQRKPQLLAGGRGRGAGNRRSSSVDKPMGDVL